MEKVEKQIEHLAWHERLKSIAQFNEHFGQGQTSRHGIGWNQIKSVSFSKMSNKQQRGKLTDITRSTRQKDCVVNEIQHAKWISSLG